MLMSGSKKFIAGAVLGALFCTLPMAGEAKAHDDKAQTKVDLQRQALPGTTRNTTEMAVNRQGSFKERIQAVLEEHRLQQEEVQTAAAVQVRQTTSAYDDNILGTPLASQEQCVRYLLSNNPHPAIAVAPEELVSYYYQEGMREGVRPDVAFAQALKETGFFSYGGTVTSDQNNYCGLGTTSAYVKGAYFASPQMGVRAHIQHLLAYATTRKPQEEVVDPRYELVRQTYGSDTLEHWEDLNGRWAVPGNSYGESILSMFQDILSK